jgi:hypothetical protein
MSKLKAVNEKLFREILGTKLGQHIDRAVAVLNNFGPKLSYDVANVMLHAVDKGKEDEVLTILEKHWEEHLQFQHPEIRGTVESMPGINKTHQVFLRICQETLALTPAAASV